ncbi:MAG: hypothetical protein JO331_06545 [Verrucomicrobia bacterium]|nr:hypothetical protein [Verrucomicrobiota bacterium]
MPAELQPLLILVRVDHLDLTAQRVIPCRLEPIKGFIGYRDEECRVFLGRLNWDPTSLCYPVMIPSRSDYLSAKFSNFRFPECKSVVVCLLLLMPVSAFASDAATVTMSKEKVYPTSEYAERDGAAEAKQDIATGNRKLKSFGLAAPWIYEYAKLLKERLGVELERIAGCVVNRDLLTYARAYNSVIQQEAEEKYGRDILGQVGREAKQLYLTKSSQTHE